MTQKVNIVLSAVVLLVMLITPSCKTSTDLVTADSPRLSVITSQQLAENLDANCTNYTTYTAKYNLSMMGLSTKVQVKIIKDEMVQLSLQPFLGVEVASITIKTDSVYMVDRINSKASADKLSNISTKIPDGAVVKLLQNMLTNSEKPTLQIKKDKINIPKDGADIEVKGQIASIIDETILIDPVEWVINSIYIDIVDYMQLKQNSSNYITTVQGKLPKNIDLSATIRNSIYVEANFELINQSFDKGVNYNTKIPSKCEIVDFKELISTYIPL